jgi:chromosome segregation ATPase
MALTAAQLKPVEREQTRQRPQAATVQAVETEISANPIAKVVLDPAVRDDQKVSALAKVITAETLKDVQAFSAYLAQRRTLAQRRLLELTSTTAFPRLQSVIGSLQGGVVDFDKMMQPMTDDLQAAFDLRTNGQMNNAMREISEDREKEAAWSTERKRIDAEIQGITRESAQIEVDLARLSLDKNWFGAVKKSALQEIAEKRIRTDRLKQDAARLEQESMRLRDEQAAYQARTGEYKAQKERLRRMLDLGPDYVKKVEAVVSKAIDFIDSSSTEVKAIRDEFDGLEDQATNVLKANAQMVRVTAVLDKGIDGATALNKERARELAVAPEGEDTLAQVTRTQEKNDVERFVSALSETATSTKKNVSALQEDAVGANSFAQVVSRQQTNLRELHGDGIASITTNLNMALQAFNTAALTEAGNNAWQAIGDMNAVTNKIRDNEVVASAMQVDDTNRRIVEKFDSLAGVSKALQEANKIRSDGISNIASSLAELAEKTAEVQRDLQVNIGLDVVGAVPAPRQEKTPDLMLKI